MKQIDRKELIMTISVVVIVTLLVCFEGIYFMQTKNKMCRDFGNKVYGHELSWLQCLVL